MHHDIIFSIGSNEIIWQTLISYIILYLSIFIIMYFMFDGENHGFPMFPVNYFRLNCSGGLQRPRPRHGHGLLRELNGRPGAFRGAGLGC